MRIVLSIPARSLAIQVQGLTKSYGKVRACVGLTWRSAGRNLWLPRPERGR